MAIIIKKFTRKTWISALSFFGIILTLLHRLIIGGGGLNLGKLEASAKNTLKNNHPTIISVAHADAADCYGSGSGGDNGPSDDGSGDDDDDGDGDGDGGDGGA